MARTPKKDWAALFNFAGGGLLHLELFLPLGGGVPGQTLIDWIAEQILLRGTHAARPNAALVAVGAEYYETDTQNRFKSDGASWLADGQSGGGSPAIQKITVTLTDSEIKALPTTGKEILAAQGAGKLIVPHSIILHLPNNVAGYTNISDGDYVVIGYKAGSEIGPYLVDDATPGLSALTSLLAGSTQNYRNIPLPSIDDTLGGGWGWTLPQLFALDSDQNKAIEIRAFTSLGDFTGGDATNSMEVTMYYSIVG